MDLLVTPQRQLAVEAHGDDSVASLPAALIARIEQAFHEGQGPGLSLLANLESKADLSPSLSFARSFGQRYFTQLCHISGHENSIELEPLAPPDDEILSGLALDAPPMKGLEYLDDRALRNAWTDLDDHIRREVRAQKGGLRAYLQERNSLWRLVGRVTFHLAENKRDEEHPFAFLSTYASGLTERGEPQHLALSRALKEYSGAANRKQLISLLTPIKTAADTLPWVNELVAEGEIYQPLAWTPAEAHRFLKDIPALEASGLIVRIPNWWRADRPPRPQVSVRIGDQRKVTLGADALLDFSVGVTFNGQSLTSAELEQLRSSAGQLVRLRGQWVEVDSEQLAIALKHWKQVEREAKGGGISFFEGMRLLAGVPEKLTNADETAQTLKHWSGVEAGEGLRSLLQQQRNPDDRPDSTPRELRATLRPYQRTGVEWLRLITGLGLGACLADDMGLGKTIQVITLLLHVHVNSQAQSRSETPSLIVAPASLLANWEAELERFAPSLRFMIAHPSESDVELQDENALQSAMSDAHVVITTYTMATRIEALRRFKWRVLILDEAQAIKNSGSRQARAVKEITADARVALTGTPVENRLSDLWSLFDFLNPGLLGGAKDFARIVKRLAEQEGQAYAPLRRLVQPYILRRLKTDERVIADLPKKTEVRAFCGLTAEQAALYAERVRELAEKLDHSEGIQRRGIVLSYLMQLKQICNHPAQWEGGSNYATPRSGKLERLAELCEELAERQEKVLIFTQFREIAQPLADTLRTVFGRPGLVLHGGTAVSKRKEMVDAFQRDDGPPYFVLSLKAGGTGLNLTAASHVIHFDRWWNPAVENQATDRAFRIGQKRNVFVHKLICRGTVEEKIDALIESKVALARDLLDESGEKLLTEMSDRELLNLVALDIHKACDA